MKVKGAAKVHLESGPNMTPLVDVVMVILIFLMLAGSFGGVEHYLVSNLPVKQNGAGSSAAKPFDDVQIDLRVDGGFSTDAPNRWTAHFGKDTSDPTELKELLKAKRLMHNSNGMATEKLQVIINPNSLVKWQSLIQVYQAALEAGYTKIAFSQAH